MPEKSFSMFKLTELSEGQIRARLLDEGFDLAEPIHVEWEDEGSIVTYTQEESE